MSDKLKNLTRVTSLPDDALIYSVDLDRAEGDRDVRITKSDFLSAVSSDDVITKYLSFRSEDVTLSGLATALNAQANFTIANGEVYIFKCIKYDSVSNEFTDLYAFTLNDLGAGAYGLLGTQLTASDIFVIGVTRPTGNDIASIASTQVINLGDIGSSEIEVGFNAHTFTGSETPVQNQSDGYVLVNATQNSNSKQWLFTGDGGTYGVGGLDTATASDFSELETNESYLQDLDSVLKQGGYAENEDGSMYIDIDLSEEGDGYIEIDISDSNEGGAFYIDKTSVSSSSYDLTSGESSALEVDADRIEGRRSNGLKSLSLSVGDPLETGVVNIKTPSPKAGDYKLELAPIDYNASTNTPALSNTDTLKEGVTYKVTVAGTQDFGAGSIILGVDDIIGNDGTIYYKKVDNNQSGGVASTSEFNPYTMLAEGNNEFVIDASIIARAGGTFSNGTPITWTILENDGSHGSSFFTGVSGNSGTKAIEVTYPEVKNVISYIITGDETISSQGISIGSTVSTTTASGFGGSSIPGAFRMVGNGTNTWSFTGEMGTSVTSSTFSSSTGYTSIGFNSPFESFENNAIAITYQGLNDYRIERLWSGIGGGYICRFRMIDNATGTQVTSFPTSDDNIIVSNVGKYKIATNFYAYSTSSINNNEFIKDNNFWCRGLFELWLKVWIVSDTSLHPKWQSKSGVTTYKLYRDTNSDFSTATLIYSGTDLDYTDTGLTADTMYYYRLDDQTDTEISRFNIKTKV